jgi:aspartyl-tRNA(Asn)/glutamyl-tRNA(Gln) amidotransferase subunit A
VTGAAPLTIADAQDALRSGAVTATELAERAFAASDAVDERLGVYLATFRDHALEAAARVDRVLADGDEPGPLAGIPIGVKDIISTLEGPTTGQSLILDPGWGDGVGDAEVVRRIRAAGAVITGKTTTMEFATGIPDPAKPFPIPRNPWNPDYWAGGSSSGSASGVATGAMLGAVGTDTGGSIRGPATFCGISGLKPTFGRVPKTGCVPLGYSLDHVGPMARTARDCAILLTVMAGHDARDVCSVDEPVPDYLAALTGDLSGVTIGVDRLARIRPDREPALDAALDAVLAGFTRLGATVVEVSLPLWLEMLAAVRVTAQSEAFAYHRPDLIERWSDYFVGTRTGVGVGPAYSGADYVQAQRVRRVAQRMLATLFDDVDLVVTPTTSLSAMPVAELESYPERAWAMHTGYWNATGNPAISIPSGFGETGMPFGLQIAGRPFDEAAVLRAADAYQRVTDFHLAIPPIAR